MSMTFAIAANKICGDNMLSASENPRYQKAVDLLADLLLDYLVQQRLRKEQGLSSDQPDNDVLVNDEGSNDSHNDCNPNVNECRTKSAA